MICKQCLPEYDATHHPVRLAGVRLCPVHELNERLAEAFRHHVQYNDDRYYGDLELLDAYDSAKGKS